MFQAVILRNYMSWLCAPAGREGALEEHGLFRPDGVEELAHIDLARTPPEPAHDVAGSVSSGAVTEADHLLDVDRDSVLKAR